MNPIFDATVKNGKAIFKNVDLFNGYLLGLEGKDIEIIVRKHKKGRTNSQNAWYWACVVGLSAEHFGYTPDEMHEAFKFLYLRRHEQGKPDTVRSTTSLTTIEFSEYVEKCRQFAAEEGIMIPDPGDIDLETPEPLKPTPKNIKEHQAQIAKEAEENKTKPVDKETLELLFARPMSVDKIMSICRDNFNGREPRELTQLEAERLDSLVLGELP